MELGGLLLYFVFLFLFLFVIRIMEQHDAICEGGSIACLPLGKPVGTQFFWQSHGRAGWHFPEWHGTMRGRSIGAYF